MRLDLRNVRTRIERLEQEAKQRRDDLGGIPPMQKILQALHGSPGFVELARGKLIRPLTEEEQQRGEHLFRRAMVDEFGPELARMIC